MEKSNNVPIIIAVVIGLIVTVVIIASILSNNNSQNPNMNNSSVAQNPTPVTQNPTPAVEKNIVELASSNDNLSTLVAAVTAADLVSALADSNANLTVFAPTNSAFSNIQSTVDTLLKPENKSQLQDILKYHVVASEALSSDLYDGQEIKTLNGSTLKVKITNGEVFINDAKVIQADIMASNGVVHVIDTVLVP